MYSLFSTVKYFINHFRRSKIKNIKIQNWRLELSSYRFDIKYRPGPLNFAADALTRNFKTKVKSAQVSSITMEDNLLSKLHKDLGCPGITRLNHQVKIRNLPYTLADVTKICQSCPSCCELKPNFYKPTPGKLIRATQPFERLSVDFKGPLPKSRISANRYILTIVDEYSRFTWAYPCKDTSTATIIKIYHELFATFGTPGTIHSDRGSGFLSTSMRSYLNDLGINVSKTTPYHPQGNGQCERFNGIIWKTVRLFLHSHKLDISNWEEVLPTALHSIRSLLNTSTNCTPHERFFAFQRRPGTIGNKILPSWLINPGPILLRNFERSNKNDSLVKQVELIQANPHYAVIKDQRGITKTVSVKDLAPFPGTQNQKSNEPEINDYEDLVQEAKTSNPKIILPKLSLPEEFVDSPKSIEEGNDAVAVDSSEEDLDTSLIQQSNVTRSGRISKFPSRYTDTY